MTVQELHYRSMGIRLKESMGNIYEIELFSYFHSKVVATIEGRDKAIVSYERWKEIVIETVDDIEGKETKTACSLCQI